MRSIPQYFENKILKVLLVSAFIFFRFTLLQAMPNPLVDSAAQGTGSKTLHKRDSIVYYKFPKGEVIRVEEVEKQIDPGLIVSVLAILISIAAILYPIYHGNKNERRSNFFKFYEYWNTDYMLKCRTAFWAIVIEFKTKNINKKVPLLLLKQKRPNDYHVYETVMDTLTDMAKLYDSNLIDRKLVISIMSTFIKSYGEALEKYFKFSDTEDSSLVKMSGKHYWPLIRLKNEIEEQNKQNGAANLNERAAPWKNDYQLK